MRATPRIHTPEDLARDVFAAKSPRDMFVALLARGFWPVAIHPQGAILYGKKEPAQGKEPMGKAWGAQRWTLDRGHAEFHRASKAGVGVCLGPGRAPGGGWLIDSEGDGPEAEESRATLFDGEDVETIGWGSSRGGHRLLTVDPDRIAALLPRLKGWESKERNQAGVYKSPELPGLELRIGGRKPDGTVKQLQSVTPPTPGTDGRPRVWTGPAIVAPVPESFYRILEGLAPKAPEAKGKSRLIAKAPDGKPITRYVLAALAGEAEKVATAAVGSRHDTLRAATMNCAGLVNSRELPEHVYRRALTEAARQCELDEGDASELIESALGLAAARDLTEAREWAERRQREQDQDQDQEQERVEPEANGHQANGQANKPAGGKARHARLVFSNFERKVAIDEEGKSTTRMVPNSMAEIDEKLDAIEPGWPKRVQETLFVATPDHEPVYLNSSTRLFAHIDRRAHVDWTKGARFVTQERFYEHRRMTSERYGSIEVMPHTPTLPDIFYMHQELPDPSGKLDQLLDFFSPETAIDRQLIKAMILTPSWGSHPGHRPGFLVTGPDHDPEQGRGLGKTELVSVISDQIYGGYIDVSPTDDISDVKTRLLTDVSTIKRIVRLDNVKTLKFSWADLEGLMTASEISGRALYKGEGRRPNTIVWFITLNGASLSKDMAQRVIPIKLKRPDFRAGWLEEVKAFASDHRWEILADVAAFLRQEPGPLKAKSRWASWERDVLSKLELSERCQAEIIERQGRADDDNSDREHIREYFAGQIARRKLNPETSCIFIPSLLAAEWLSTASRKHFETNKASAQIRGLGIAELTPTREKKRRGFIWLGKDSTTCDPVDFSPEETSPFGGETTY